MQAGVKFDGSGNVEAEDAVVFGAAADAVDAATTVVGAACSGDETRFDSDLIGDCSIKEDAAGGELVAACGDFVSGAAEAIRLPVAPASGHVWLVVGR